MRDFIACFGERTGACNLAACHCRTRHLEGSRSCDGLCKACAEDDYIHIAFHPEGCNLEEYTQGSAKYSCMVVLPKIAAQENLKICSLLHHSTTFTMGIKTDKKSDKKATKPSKVDKKADKKATKVPPAKPVSAKDILAKAAVGFFLVLGRILITHVTRAKQRLL